MQRTQTSLINVVRNMLLYTDRLCFLSGNAINIFVFVNSSYAEHFSIRHIIITLF